MAPRGRLAEELLGEPGAPGCAPGQVLCRLPGRGADLRAVRGAEAALRPAGGPRCGLLRAPHARQGGHRRGGGEAI